MPYVAKSKLTVRVYDNAHNIIFTNPLTIKCDQMVVND